MASSSVSFGRFETESLSWERRSSFSRNRYLEEVEKCSRPGLVIEKKAYFEAHFKRKALLHESSSENQSETGCESLENGTLDHISYSEHLQKPHNRDSFEVYCTDIRDESDDHDYVFIDCKKECEHASPSESQTRFLNTNGDKTLVDNVHQVNDSESIHQSQVECSATLFYGNISNIEEGAHKNEDDDLKQIDEYNVESGNRDSIVIGEHVLEAMNMAEFDEMAAAQITSKEKPSSVVDKSPEILRRVNDTEEEDTTNSIFKGRHPATVLSMEVHDKRSIQTGKNLTHATKQIGRSRPLSDNMVMDRWSALKTTPVLSSVPNNLKSGKNRSIKESFLKSCTLSGKTIKSRGHDGSPHSVSAKREIPGGKSVDRSKLPMSLGESDTVQNNVVFKFKSEERAEKRKEFNMKLEEKMQEKKAMVNQAEAEKQEKTQAEIKQLRKSLNFKATPMPAFYLDATTQGSNDKEAVRTRSAPQLQRALKGAKGVALAAQSAPPISKSQNRCHMSSQSAPHILKLRSHSCTVSEDPSTSVILSGGFGPGNGATPHGKTGGKGDGIEQHRKISTTQRLQQQRAGRIEKVVIQKGYKMGAV